MDNNWKVFFEEFADTVRSEQLPVKLPRFDLDLGELAGAAADWCHQYLKDRKCPTDLIVCLTQKVINELRVPWTVEPESFGYRPEKKDYQSLWLMQQVIGKLNEICLNYNSTLLELYHPLQSSVWWSSFVLKNARRSMEDYITVVPFLHTLFDIKGYAEASFYAVYDGHNGHDAAVYSSMYLHQLLVQSSYYPTNPENAFYDAFFNTDKIFTHKTEKYNLVSGTTAVCVLYRPQEKKIYVAWVGDSLATLWKNGTPLSLVNKHVPQRNDENQRIRDEGGIVTNYQGIYRVDGQLSVSRAIGDVRYKPHISAKPEMRAIVLDGNEEFLVLGSDGLWDYVDTEDVADTIYDELLEAEGDPSEVCSKLAFKAKAQGSKDNISVITVFLQDPQQLAARRKAHIMETAMEQRNSLSSSYGQDTSGFGPETDVDTPDEPIIGLSKPKVVPTDEGEVNESSEDSEDGGGWNYTNGNQQRYSENDRNAEAEDMDRRLNPDAPEFVPVSSPPRADNYVNRFLATNEEFISSSPQKFRETIDNEDVPDEDDFASYVKAADLSKLDNAYESKGEFNTINGIKPLDEEPAELHEQIKRDVAPSDLMFENDQEPAVGNGDDFDEYRRIPFDQATDGPVDMNRARNLFDDDKMDNAEPSSVDADPYTSLMETMVPTKKDEFNPFAADKIQEELNASFSENGSISMDSKVNGGYDDGADENETNGRGAGDDSVSTANATVGSVIPQFDDEDVTTTEFFDGNRTMSAGGYEDSKLDDSASTTEAVLGSEPCTPMRMVNQSTFESDNDDVDEDQYVAGQRSEGDDKENDDPFSFDRTAVEDPEGIVPTGAPAVVNPEVVKPAGESMEQSITGEPVPVEEPEFIKQEAKAVHSVYEQQYLPESDFTTSTHEALMNTNAGQDNDLDNAVSDTVPEVDLAPHNAAYSEQEPETEDSDVDEVKCHAEGLDQFRYDTEPVAEHQDSDFELKQDDVSDFQHQQHHDDFAQQGHDVFGVSENHLNGLEQHGDVFEQKQIEQTKATPEDNGYEADRPEGVAHQDDHREVVDSDEEMHSSMIIHSDVESNPPQPYCSATDTLTADPDMMSRSMTFEENFQNRNMSDSLYVMETSSDYFGDLKETNECPEPSVEEPKAVNEFKFNEELNVVEEPQFNEEPNVVDKPQFNEEPNFVDKFKFNEEPKVVDDFKFSEEPKMVEEPVVAEEPNVVEERFVVEEPAVVEEQVSNVFSVEKPSDEIVIESKPEVVDEQPTVEETPAQLAVALDEPVQEPKVVVPQEDNNKVSEIGVAAAAGVAVAAAAAGAVALASKKSTAPKKPEVASSKAKTTTMKAAPKPLASKPTVPAAIKKTTVSTTAAKPKTATTSTTSKSASATSRPSTGLKTTSVTLKPTTITKMSSKPLAPKTTVAAPRPSTGPKTPTTPRTSTTLKTSTTPKTPTSPRTGLNVTKTPPTSKPITSTTTPRTSLASKPSLTNGTPRPPSRPISAAAKKPLTNGTAKLTNGDASKLAPGKGPVNLATRTSLAPPKLPAKAKPAPKPTVAPPAMPGPIRRPIASATKKTETATS